MEIYSFTINAEKRQVFICTIGTRVMERRVQPTPIETLVRTSAAVREAHILPLHAMPRHTAADNGATLQPNGFSYQTPRLFHPATSDDTWWKPAGRHKPPFVPLAFFTHARTLAMHLRKKREESKEGGPTSQLPTCLLNSKQQQCKMQTEKEKCSK